ncbi:hypothetical protein J0H58_34325 [bacterium]|nr:hypothetical protein [bacterium]
MPRLVVLPDEFHVIPREVFLTALAKGLATPAGGQPTPSPERCPPAPSPRTATAPPPSSYLVTAYCLSDNVPVGMCDSRAEAEEFAREVARDPQSYIGEFRKLAGYDPVFHKESSWPRSCWRSRGGW